MDYLLLLVWCIDRPARIFTRPWEIFFGSPRKWCALCNNNTAKGNPEENKRVPRRERKTSWMRLASAHLFGLVPHIHTERSKFLMYYPCESQQRILTFLFFKKWRQKKKISKFQNKMSSLIKTAAQPSWHKVWSATTFWLEIQQQSNFPILHDCQRPSLYRDNRRAELTQLLVCN